MTDAAEILNTLQELTEQVKDQIRLAHTNLLIDWFDARITPATARDEVDRRMHAIEDAHPWLLVEIRRYVPYRRS